MSAPSFVYFVQAGDGGPIKIGTSRNVPSRLSKICTDQPAKLKILLIVSGDAVSERRFHMELDAYRTRGEWFEPHAGVLAVIERERANGASINILQLAPSRAPKSPLEAWRRENGITLADLAVMVGTSDVSLSRIENRKQRPGWDILDAIYRVTKGKIMPNDFMRPGLLDSVLRPLTERAA